MQGCSLCEDQSLGGCIIQTVVLFCVGMTHFVMCDGSSLVTFIALQCGGSHNSFVANDGRSGGPPY